MWVALDNIPLWIEAVDVLGRITPVHGAHYRATSLELDASGFPVGAVLLRIGMPDGERCVRLMKL